MDARGTRVWTGGGVTGSWSVEASERVATAKTIMPFSEGEYRFRSYQLLPGARMLLRDGQPVEIGSRAFDLLHILLRSRGAVVERAAIFRHVWPTTTVDESNLRFQISCLRKALGGDRDLLKTVPGRGYLLAAEMSLGARDPNAADRRLGRGVAAADLPADDTPETCQALRGLLRAVLDELRDLTRDGRRDLSAPPRSSGAASG